MIRSLALSLSFASIMVIGIGAQAAAPQGKIEVAGKAALSKKMIEITSSAVYLEGVTNDRYTTGSNSFALLLDRSGKDQLRASLRLNPGGPKMPNLTSNGPEHLHLNVVRIENRKSVESIRLAFKGAKLSEVGTRVLTYQARNSSALGDGYMIGKVQQLKEGETLWKTTGTILKFVPAGEQF